MATKEKTEPKTGDAKKKALAEALKKIEKNFGAGAVMRMGDKTSIEVDAVSSGVTSLDIALGVGGFPRGRIVEIYGPESSGKTTIALHTVAAVQAAGGTAAYIDAENAMDPKYAANLGVDIDDMLLSQPDTGEEGLQIADALVSSGAVDVIVIDSVAALVPKAEIDGEIGDSHVGLQARMMSQALRTLAGKVSKTKTLLIFINQLREKVGVMFGNPETTPGGRALKFYATIRLEVRKGGQVKDHDLVLGNVIKIKVVKNKVAPPFKTVESTITFGKGVDHYADLLSLATADKVDIIKKSGSWYSYGDTRIGQGAVNATKYLADNPEVTEEITKKIMDYYVPKDDAEEAAEEAKKPAAAKKGPVQTELTPADDDDTPLPKGITKI
ncbi:recombinase RecA [Lacticaseibacillus hulanensis]|uniref:recombinase RecA n=1 Tax=Lacticaseibacillus hulanensis TaxID=2493111 RepID=UPI000FDAF9AC|nr:recombinase RecA [Lacticaseibacillus hulanensis]